MALSGNEPISSGNLKSVLTGGIPNMVLMHDTQDTGTSVECGRDLSDFDILLVDVGIGDRDLNVWTTAMIKPGHSRIFMCNSTTYTVEAYGRTVEITDNPRAGACSIGRIIGIKF